MDQQELDDWRSFCEGTQPFEPQHFSRIFMEMFFKPTEKDRADLRTVFSYVPKSAHTLEMMMRICDGSDAKSDQEITDLVRRDLRELRPIMTYADVLRAMDLGIREITADHTRFWQTADSLLNREFHAAMCDYSIEELYRQPNNEKLRALSEAFYGIAINQHLQCALTADLLGCDVSFQNYIELYLIGVDYALDANGVVVFNHSTT